MPLHALLPSWRNRDHPGVWDRLAVGDACFQALLEDSRQRTLATAGDALKAALAAAEADPQRIADLAIVSDMLACAELATMDGGSPERLAELLRRFDADVALQPGLKIPASSLEPAAWLSLLRGILLGDSGPDPARDAAVASPPLRWTPKRSDGRFTSLSGEWAWDLVLRFSGRPRPVEGIRTITALLVVKDEAGKDGEGRTGLLTLEALADEGRGRLYPDPATMSFLARDQTFIDAELAAVEWVKSQGLWPGVERKAAGTYPGGCDVRWRLEYQDPRRRLPAISGGSMGAAFAVGLAKLLVGDVAREGDPLRTNLAKLNLTGVAATAQVTAAGALLPISETFEKLLAAARQAFLPRVHTVLVASAQRADDKETEKQGGADTAGSSFRTLGLLPDPLNPSILKDPSAAFHVVRADSVAKTVDLLALDARGRWGEIRDFGDELRRHRDLVGRDWLKQRIESWVQETTSGYLLLQAGPGLGKTALAAERVRSRPDTVFHLIKRGMGDWDEPDVILGSLTAQLRRKYALLPTDSEQRMTPGGAFNSTLQRVSQELQRLSQELEPEHKPKEIVYLDGLDEAFGPTGRFSRVALPGVLPRVLPDGVLMVLSSRPGEFLSWLADPQLCKRVDVSGEEPESLADVEAYLRQQDESRGLGLGDGLLQSLVRASEGCFAVAVKYVEERPKLVSDLAAWRADPSGIPVGLTGWAREHWQRLAGASEARGISTEIARAILGILASARTPLSREQLQSFLVLAARHRAAGSPEPSIGLLQFGRLAERLTEVLGLSREFFDPQDPDLGPQAPHRFFHTQFPEFIRGELSQVERDDCHYLLARGCGAVVQDERTQGPARDYALRYRLEHLIAAGRWQELAEAFGDAAYVVERSQLEGPGFGFVGVYADAQAAAAHPGLTPEWREWFTEWELFLRFRNEQRLSIHPEMYAQEVVNEFLPLFDTAFRGLFHEHCRVRQPQVCLSKAYGPSAISRNAGHTNAVRWVEFSPDSRRIASASDDWTLRIWATTRPGLIAECQGHRGAVQCVAFSPSGNRVVSGSADGTVKIWDPDSGSLLADCQGHLGSVQCIAFSPSGNRVASGSQDGTLKIWDSESGALLANCVGDDSDTTSLAFLPDETRLASGSFGRLKIWDAQAGHQVGDYWLPGPVSSLACSEDGRLAVGIGRSTTRPSGGFLQIWDATSGRLLADCDLTYGGVTSVAWSRDGDLVVSGDDNCCANVWHADGRWVARYSAHKHKITSVAFSPDGATVATASLDGTVKLWDTWTARLKTDCPAHEGPVTTVAYSPDGTVVGTGGQDCAVRLWDPVDGRLRADYKEQTYVDGVALSASGLLMAMVRDCTIEVCDARTGAPVSHWTWPLPGGMFDRRVRSIAMSSDGDRVVSVDRDGMVKVWNAKTGNALIERTGAYRRSHRSEIWCAAFAPDGQRILSGGDDGLKIWDADNGRLIAESHDYFVRAVCFAPHGRQIATGGFGGYRTSGHHFVFLYDAETLAQQRRWAPHDCWAADAAVRCVAFAPDGCAIAFGSDGGRVTMRRVDGGDLIADWVGHAKAVTTVSFLGNSGRVVSGSRDGTVRIWDVGDSPARPGGEPRCVSALYYDAAIMAVAFIPSNDTDLLVVDARGNSHGYRVGAERY